MEIEAKEGFTFFFLKNEACTELHFKYLPSFMVMRLGRSP